MKKYMTSILNFIRKETVLAAAILLAALSMFFAPPSRAYLDYVDWNTLLLLFALMAVMAGFQSLGLFQAVAGRLLGRVKNTRMLFLILIFLPFFFGMAITNDVALITFVPFAIVTLRMCKAEELLVPLVVMQTLGANMGSMLTPMGNPQNLYLYARSGMSLPSFLLVMLPYTALSGLVLVIAVFLRKNQSITLDAGQTKQEFHPDPLHLAGYSIGFLLCLLCVAKALPPVIAALALLAFLVLCDRAIIRKIDYSLLGTFIGFFLFIGNLGSLESFRKFLSHVIEGNVLPVAVLSSQVISNVPAALLLSGFTDNWSALIVGTNLGSLGTLIASMASLISYKQIVSEYPQQKGRYFLRFTLGNIGLLLILLLFHVLIT